MVADQAYVRRDKPEKKEKKKEKKEKTEKKKQEKKQEKKVGWRRAYLTVFFPYYISLT